MPSDSSEPGDPEETIGAYQQALEAQDWELVEPLFHPDCTVVFSSGTYQGLSQVEAAFRRNFEVIEDERYEIIELQWLERSADRAVALYDFAWQGVIDGKPAAGGGRGTSVLVRGPGGWQILLEHLGPPAPP